MDTNTVRQLAAEATRGDPAATEFILKLACVLHLWDDLIDKDKPLEDDAIHQAFQYALIDLPRNPFYARNFVELNALLANAITNWHIANRMEREDGDYEKTIAFIIRSSYVDLHTHVAQIIGGPQWAVEMGYKARRHAHSEGFEGYLTNLAQEFAARAQREGGA